MYHLTIYNTLPVDSGILTVDRICYYCDTLNGTFVTKQCTENFVRIIYTFDAIKDALATINSLNGSAIGASMVYKLERLPNK